ncbi:hypothetical protein [Bremerella alba]|uniref:Uncharacterized protein n=1 Tax=Bremerella alba TaxID=980252 RepID=A0A7V8V241_9BACT|nr:hypothetical protein [Bremerella alba]MBA2113504.1 hypothetical protein [Bremerella alba]
MNDKRYDRVSFYFVLLTAFLNFALSTSVINLEQGPATVFLTMCILGLSLGQMTLCLILLMQDASSWKLPSAGFIVSLLFGLTVTLSSWGAPFDRVLVILLATLFFGIAPVAIYRVVFVGMQVQFSLSLLFGLMTLVTIACAVAIQVNLDWGWFLTFIFYFLGTAVPIPLAGFMLVARRTISMRRYVTIMSLLVVISVIMAASTERSTGDISLVAQIAGFMSLYLLGGGVVILREAKSQRPPQQSELLQPSGDPIAVD